MLHLVMLNKHNFHPASASVRRCSIDENCKMMASNVRKEENTNTCESKAFSLRAMLQKNENADRVREKM